MKIATFCTCLWALFQASQSNVNVTRGYIFTAPKRFLSGRNEKGCFSYHNLEPPVHVFLELHASSSNSDDAKNEEVLARVNTVFNSDTGSCLELYVPFTKFSLGKLKLKMEFEKHPDYVVNAEKEVFIENDSLLTFVETDKPVYKPGQDVNIRILMLKNDLRPWHKSIPRVWIENPSEVRVAQWTNTTTDTGMCQLTFSLSKESIPGTWKIKVEKAHHQTIHTTTFEVKKYVLPRFQVTVSSPGYILADAENITWKICAKYSYGKPVKGALLLKTTPQTPLWRRKLHNLPDINYETKVDTPDGCTDFTISGESLGLPHWKVAPNNIILIANFTEAGTDVVETVNSKTVVVYQSLKLEFAPYTPRYFKLGLPYHGKLRVLHYDDTPAPKEKIQLCLRVRAKDEWLRVVECRNFTSSNEGFVDFVVPPQHKNIVSLSFVATGVNYPMKYYSPDKRWRVFMEQPSSYIDINLWFSPSDSYLLVAPGYQPVICEEKYPFNVMYTVPSNMSFNEPITFRYSINSRGRLLIFGHLKHKPHKESLLNYSEFNNLLGAAETLANRTDLNQVVHRFPLSVKITPNMSPVSELLLYYVRPNGEIVTASYTIEVGNCFENKVSASWKNDVQQPGAKSKLQIEAAPFSFCGVSAVDRSTRYLSSNENILDSEATFKRLRRFHLTSEARPIQSAWAHCGKERAPPIDPFENGEDIDHLPIRPAAKVPAWNAATAATAGSRRKRHALYPSGTNYVDASQAFDDFGAIVMSDLTLETRPCPLNRFALPVGAREIDEPDRIVRMMAMPLVFPFTVADESMESDANYVDQSSDQTTTLRSYFPETWLWELVHVGKQGKETIERPLPHTITDWIGSTVCVSAKSGLGIAQKTVITAFQSFFLDYNLPYSVKRGEMLHLKVSLFNYMHHSLPVKITLQDAPGLDLLPGTSTIGSFCVKSRDNVVHEYLLKAKKLGEINITVSAEIESDYSAPCGPETLVFIRDSIVKPILVQPEGFPVELTTSAFICPKDFVDDSSVSWNLTLPEDLVPDSARASVSLIGDILGPALENLDDLVRLPMGCGEQNMILFVPNIHVINYLDATGRQDPSLRSKAIKNMQKGYQRELNYRHPDGSYSAFGPDSTEGSGSMWLTAFVVKSFAQARSLIHVDERDLKLSVKWIIRKQLENGCFPAVGRIFHKDMKGGLKDNEEDSSSAALTAYVLISLLESSVPLSAPLINNALYCLEKGAENNEGPYTLALTTYALALLEHPKVNESLETLMKQATRHRDLIWWEDESKQAQLALSVEMTTYAVLTLLKIGGEANMVNVLKAVRWMSKQRNSGGGFTSTQDTVLGLEALSKYATTMAVNKTDLSVLVTAGPDVDRVFRMNDDNRMVLSRVAVPDLPIAVEIFAEGEGCVLVQTSLFYNKRKTTGSEAFDVSISSASQVFMDECVTQNLKICARYKLADEESNMALIEVGMISGYVPDRASLQNLVENPATNVQRYEEEKDKVVLYFGKLTSQLNCIGFVVNRETVVDRPKSANVKLYDYYQQELSVSTSYKFPEMCSGAEDENEGDQIPNPVPMEPKLTTSATSVENKPHHSGVTRSVGKALRKNEVSVKNKLDDEKIEHKADPEVPSEKKVNSIAKQESTATGIEPKDGNVPLVDSIEAKIHEDASAKTGFGSYQSGQNDTIANINVPPQVDFGSGEVPLDAVENVPESEKFSQKSTNDSGDIFEGNPSFVVVFHELETPDTLEGPSPVYVKAPDDMVFNFNFSSTDSAFSSTESATTKSFSEHENVTSAQIQTNKEEDRPGNESCPICGEKVPENIKQIVCSARSLVKMAVRRNRRVRLMYGYRINSGVTQEMTKLRSSVAFALTPSCACSVLDKSETFAVLLDSEKDGYLRLPARAKVVLNSSISLFTLSDVQDSLGTFIQWGAKCP